jgi:CRISPR-associated protein Csd2
MSTKHKYDFAVILSVKNANPNGDPLNGNRPRTNYDDIGEISDVCLKRKIRNRLLHTNENILIQSDDNRKDEHSSIKARIDASGLKTSDKNFKKQACKKWYDVRAFGQVFAFAKGKEASGVSIPVRGPVSIHPAYSLEPVNITSIQITKSTNAEDKKKKDSEENAMSSDRMGMKHRVDFGIYTFFGSINSQLASDETGTGFTDEDAQKLKLALCSMFENDASSARPDGSMEILKVIWWKHSCPSGDISSAKVHGTLKDNVDPKDGSIVDEGKLRLCFTKDEGEGELKPDVMAGF